MIRHLFRSCWFSHASDPVIVMHGTVMHFACRSCQADLGAVLPGQTFKARRVPKPKKRKSADVIRMAKRKAG